MRKTGRMKRSRLSFSKKPLRELVKWLVKDETILVTDPFNHPKLQDLGKTILVTANNQDRVDEIREQNYSSIIAVGGCTALDIGRACAVSKELIAIPTILSTDCLSVDKSVLKGQDGKDRLVQTVAPNAAIISIPALIDTDPKELAKWSSSGFGDLFANVGAAIDQDFRESGNIAMERIRLSISEIFKALNWASTRFSGYDVDELMRLARWCHNASIRIMSTNRPAGGEHKLYYSMKENEGFSNQRPTHGQLVSVGTLITARIAAERTQDFSVYEELRNAFLRLGLPSDYIMLANVGIEKEQLVRGIGTVSPASLIEDHFSNGDFSLLDRVFGTQPKVKKRKEAHFTKQGLRKALEELKARHSEGYTGLLDELIRQIRDYWEKNEAPKLILGLSGGVDSSVVAFLAEKAVGNENVITLTIPAWKGDNCVELAGLIRKELGIEQGGVLLIDDLVIQMANKVGELTGKKPVPGDISFGNIASRIRVNYFYAVTNAVDGRVIGTGNRTEFVQGYATKFGTPNSCDFGILDELYKTDIYEIAKILGVPQEIMEAKPTTGFYQGQTHEEELGATMEEMDAAAFLLFEKKLGIDRIVDEYGASRKFIKLVAQRYVECRHKRMLRPPHVKIGFICDDDV